MTKSYRAERLIASWSPYVVRAAAIRPRWSGASGLLIGDSGRWVENGFGEEWMHGAGPQFGIISLLHRGSAKQSRGAANRHLYIPIWIC